MRTGLRAAARGQWAEANKAFELALEETGRFHGPRSFEAGAVASAIAQKQVEQARWKEARRLFRHAYVIFADLKRNDKAVATVQELVPVLYELGEYTEATQLLRWALTTVDGGTVPAHAHGPLTEQLAETLLRHGRPAEAIPLYEDAVATLEAGGRATACELVTAMGNLGLAYAAAGQPELGDRRSQRGLAVAERQCRAALPSALLSRSLLELNAGRPAAARPLLERASVLAREHQNAQALGEVHVLLQRVSALEQASPGTTMTPSPSP